MQMNQRLAGLKASRSSSAPWGAAVPAMPSGAIGLWYADEYDASKLVVPNAAAATEPGETIFFLPNGAFSSNFIARNAVTIVDGAVAGPDGSARQGSTLVGDATDWYLNPTIENLPAGTYTYSIDMASTDASDYPVRLGALGGELTVTVTPTWQTFDRTFTVGSGNLTLIMCRAVGGAPVNIKIANARLVAGASRGAAEVIAGHMRMGLTRYSTSNNPAVAAGAIDFATNKYGIVQLPDNKTLTSWTILAVGKRTADRSNISTILSPLNGTSFVDFSPAFHGGLQGPGNFYFGGDQFAGGGVGGLWTPLTTDDYQVITNRYDGSIGEVFHNEALALRSAVNAGKSAVIRNLWAGPVNSLGNVNGYKVNAIALYDRALTDAEVRQAVAVLIARAQVSSLPVATQTRFLLAEGDSITQGVGASDSLGSYAHRSGANLSPRAFGVVNAISGAQLGSSSDTLPTNSLYARAAKDDAIIPTDKKGRIYILTVLIGRNDGGIDPTLYSTQVGAYIQARKAAGWDRVVLCTCLPSTAGGFNTWRTTYNTAIKAGGFATTYGVDAICDFDTVTGMGANADASNATNYPDGTHPSNAGYILLEAKYRAVINALT